MQGLRVMCNCTDKALVMYMYKTAERELGTAVLNKTMANVGEIQGRCLKITVTFNHYKSCFLVFCDLLPK